MTRRETTIRVLSVRQPFTDQILTPHPKHPVLPQKWCENRSWSTDYRGWLYIHASGRHRTLPTGAILGHVTLVGIIQPVPNPPKCRRMVRNAYELAGLTPPSSNWEHSGVNWDSTHWWLLANPIRLREPILTKGNLRLWSFTPSPGGGHPPS